MYSAERPCLVGGRWCSPGHLAKIPGLSFPVPIEQLLYQSFLGDGIFAIFVASTDSSGNMAWIPYRATWARVVRCVGSGRVFHCCKDEVVNVYIRNLGGAVIQFLFLGGMCWSHELLHVVVGELCALINVRLNDVLCGFCGSTEGCWQLLPPPHLQC